MFPIGNHQNLDFRVPTAATANTGVRVNHPRGGEYDRPPLG